MDLPQVGVETNAGLIVSALSSGTCPPPCQYCIIHPIPKHEPFVTSEDLAYSLDALRMEYPGGEQEAAVPGEGGPASRGMGLPQKWS